MTSIIIQGSARGDGNTRKVVNVLLAELKCHFIDLTEVDIGHFDYDFNNQGDDFHTLVTRILKYDLIIFATPVYWYSMSGRMKVFFDRLSDCLKIAKETGRKFRGKSMAAISCGSGPGQVEGYFVPFESTAGYLGMKYLGHLHTWAADDEPLSTEITRSIKQFAHSLSSIEETS